MREEIENENDEEEFELVNKYIETDKGSDRLVRDLFYEYEVEKDLIINPDFQRNFVWDSRMAGKLIESILLNVPIPIIYTVEDSKYAGKTLVIDGQQRLTSIFSFIGGRFPDGKHFKLPSKKVMKFFPNLANKTYREIDEEMPGFLKENFLNRPIRVVKILKKSNEDAKYMLFERLNTGAKQLNDQELRNCVFHGKYNQFLKEMSKNEDFQFILNMSKKDKRMQDIELVLRFFAFYNTNFIDYKPPVKKFLNTEITMNIDLDEETKTELEKEFKKSVSLCRTIFGKNAFRRFTIGDTENPNGRYEKKLNKALFEILMWGFTRYDKNQIMQHADAIFEELLFLQSNNEQFLKSIFVSTNKQEHVQYRFKTWWESLQKIIGTPKTEKRCFSYALKKELFEKNNICVECGSEIKDIGDAAVDHIKPYWRGGETIPENARLLHRYCNLKLGKKR